jgi:hypothetical protein
MCLRYFSAATTSKNYLQKRRDLNSQIVKLLVANVSQRETARILNINKKTVARKMVIMGLRAKTKLGEFNACRPKAVSIQFDDMETFEHTKCKPVSIFLAVEESTRRILNYSVARMPAKGLLARKSLKKYGIRKDERAPARKKSFLELSKIVDNYAEIKSDENPHYHQDVRIYFPNANYKTYKGRDG